MCGRADPEVRAGAGEGGGGEVRQHPDPDMRECPRGRQRPRPPETVLQEAKVIQLW